MYQELRSLTVISAALALALGSFGCGDDDDAPRPDAAPGTPDAAVAAPDAAPEGPDATPGNNDPTASFTFTPDCTTNSSTEVTFTSTSTDPDGDTLTCTWTFTSGTPATGTDCEVTGVTYPSVSPYGIALVVDDGNGATAMANDVIAPCP